MAKYTGDCRTGIRDALSAERVDALRTANATTAMQDRAYELDAGSSITFFYKWLSDAGFGPPNKVTIQVRRDNDNTVIRTYQTDGARPADGTSFTFFGTSDGTQTGSPRAGVVRLYLRHIKDNAAVSTANYDVDSDGTFTTLPAGATGIADQGCLRSNAIVSALSVSAYPAGATFAYPDTITLSATHTQRFGDTNVETARLDLTDSSDVQFIAGSSAEATTTTFSQNFSVSDTFPASAANYGSRFLPIGNAGFVPTSGAILWTKFVASGVTQDGNNVKRSIFYAVDPRVTCTHHFQVDDDVFGVAKDDTSKQMLSTQSGFIWTIFKNARGEGQDGLTITQTLDPQAPGTTVGPTSSSTSTQDSQAGVSGRIDWTASKPGGSWDKTVDITAPAAIDANTHLVSATDTLTMLNVDPRVRLVVSLLPSATGTEGRHLQPGDDMQAVATFYNGETHKRIAPDAGTVKLFLARWNIELSRFEYLESDGATWTNWSGSTTVAATVAMTDAGDGVTFTTPFTSTSGWTALDIVAIAVTGKVGGTPYSFYESREFVEKIAHHAPAIFDPTGLFR